MRVIISSVPGAGKTTIMEYVQKKLPSAKFVNTGDLILQLAKKKFKIKNRDEMRKKLTVDEQRWAQHEAAKKIAKIRSKILFIDTHLSVETPHGYFPGLTEDVMHILKPEMIIVLEFRPEDILARRKKDKSRKRDVESLEQIEKHQQTNREFGFVAAEHVGAGVVVIDLRWKQKKPFDHAKQAAAEIVKLVKS